MEPHWGAAAELRRQIPTIISMLSFLMNSSYPPHDPHAPPLNLYPHSGQILAELYGMEADIRRRAHEEFKNTAGDDYETFRALFPKTPINSAMFRTEVTVHPMSHLERATPDFEKRTFVASIVGQEPLFERSYTSYSKFKGDYERVRKLFAFLSNFDFKHF